MSGTCDELSTLKHPKRVAPHKEQAILLNIMIFLGFGERVNTFFSPSYVKDFKVKTAPDSINGTDQFRAVHIRI